jgi:methyl-accepting chemotaxis protein
MRFEQGNDALGEAMIRIQGVSASIMAATTQMAELETEMGSIGSVLDLIHSIASNTHMLSLNATIEAARAGRLAAVLRLSQQRSAGWQRTPNDRRTRLNA